MAYRGIGRLLLEAVDALLAVVSFSSLSILLMKC